MQSDAVHETERLYYRPKEVAQLTGLGLRTVYKYIYAGEIPSRKIGNARLVPAEALRNWVATDVKSPGNQYSLGYSSAPKNVFSHFLHPANIVAVAFLASLAHGIYAVLSYLQRTSNMTSQFRATARILGNCLPSSTSHDRTVVGGRRCQTSSYFRSLSQYPRTST